MYNGSIYQRIIPGRKGRKGRRKSSELREVTEIVPWYITGIYIYKYIKIWIYLSIYILNCT